MDCGMLRPWRRRLLASMALLWLSAVRLAVAVVLLVALGVALFMLPVEKILKDFLVWIQENLGPWGPLVLAATKHSQSASNAFLRGDHAAAKELSLRAQEERAAAEKLTNKAAEEIFPLNSDNNIWKINLHGLHASEAVVVLERHLHMIEFQQSGNKLASTEDLARLDSESTTCSNIELATEKVVLCRPKQSILHVITGMGNHSKGQASLFFPVWICCGDLLAKS